ncbi:hypothetical protein FWG86_01760 [Candidatus Saccharibacteria bacterium]|nr:hypothetical protein [Candidatus Saccharibacteria bacterium]
MHKRFRILLAAAVIILSSLSALFFVNTAIAAPIGSPHSFSSTHSTTDGEHIQDIRCERGSDSRYGTITFTFTDGFQGSLDLDAGSSYFAFFTWDNTLNCQNAVNSYLDNLTTGNRNTFVRCPPGLQCWLNTDTDRAYSLGNYEARLFPSDQPPANATITATPNTIELVCPVLNVNTIFGDSVGTSNVETVTVNLSGTTASWARTNSTNSSLMTSINGDQLSIQMLGLGCSVGPSGISTRNDTITIGVPGTNVSTTIAVTTTIQLNDVMDPNDGFPPGWDSEGGAVDPTARECDLGKFGWALCPIMTGIDSMLGGLYSWVESNFLQIQLDFYNTGSGTFQAWSVFRNLANILFVIFFLVVIFSQITSVGISSYGLKKMLPEIIMAAILINLSFFIVQFMIDLSNIVGFQIKALLENLVSAGPVVENAGLLENLTSVLGAVAIVAGVAVGATLIGLALAGGLGALFAAVILFLLAALIGILILFLLLVVRQVGVIILVVLAPLAFAARILPNTQGLFKTWWKMITTLLLVYPICGLVIGGGKMAGRIIIMAVEGGTMGTETVGRIASIFGPEIGGQISHFAAVSGSLMYVVVAMIAMIAPYFAVITIIKDSLNGLGKLGGAITGKMAGVEKWGKSNINKAPGVRSLQRTLDTGRAGRAAKLKAKAEVANAKVAAKPNSAVAKMQKAEFAAAQTRDDAVLVSLGVYAGNDAHLLKVSRANAIKRGEYQAGNETFDRIARGDVLGVRNTVAHATQNAKKGFAQAGRNIQGVGQGIQRVGLGVASAATLGKSSTIRSAQTALETKRSALGAANIAASGPDSYEMELQAQAKTAVQMQDKKIAAKIDATYAEMGAQAVYDEVMDGGNIRAGITNGIQIERAVKKMVDKGEWEKAAQITQAYTSDTSLITSQGRKRLGEELANGNVKEQAFDLHAYGKLLEDNPSTTDSLDSFITDTGTTGLQAVIKSGTYNQQLSTMHGETATRLAQLDTTGNVRREAIEQMNGQTIGRLGEQNLSKFLGRNLATGAAIAGSHAFSVADIRDNTPAGMFTHIRQNYAEAGTNAANWGYSTSLKSGLDIP